MYPRTGSSAEEMLTHDEIGVRRPTARHGQALLETLQRECRPLQCSESRLPGTIEPAVWGCRPSSVHPRRRCRCPAAEPRGRRPASATATHVPAGRISLRRPCQNSSPPKTLNTFSKCSHHIASRRLPQRPCTSYRFLGVHSPAALDGTASVGFDGAGRQARLGARHVDDVGGTPEVAHAVVPLGDVGGPSRGRRHGLHRAELAPAAAQSVVARTACLRSATGGTCRAPAGR